MFLNQVHSSSYSKIPHWSSVSNWVCRAGLGLLQSVKPWDMRPWIAIIDISTAYSMKKALVVLRVPLDHFLNRIGAPSLAAVECIGIELENNWNYKTIHQSLERIFKLSGHPSAIVKDGGNDLKKGVDYWLKKNRHCGQISDVGHIVANILKHMYSKNNVFLSFLKLLNSAQKKLFMTELAFLKPPKIRTKGRFQNISKIVIWSQKILSLLSVSGQVKKNSLVYKLRRVFPGLNKYRLFISRFLKDCQISNEFMEELKNKGLNQESYQKSKKILEQLPETSELRQKLLVWLSRHMRIQCQLKIGQTPLLVSSDIIETFMGSIKHIIERNPLNEFGRMVLAAPLFCGKYSTDEIEKVLQNTTHKTLKEWEERNTNDSMRRKKSALFNKPPHDRNVQDPPITKAA